MCKKMMSKTGKNAVFFERCVIEYSPSCIAENICSAELVFALLGENTTNSDDTEE